MLWAETQNPAAGRFGPVLISAWQQCGQVLLPSWGPQCLLLFLLHSPDFLQRSGILHSLHPYVGIQPMGDQKYSKTKSHVHSAPVGFSHHSLPVQCNNSLHSCHIQEIPSSSGNVCTDSLQTPLLLRDWTPLDSGVDRGPQAQSSQTLMDTDHMLARAENPKHDSGSANETDSHEIGR